MGGGGFIEIIVNCMSNPSEVEMLIITGKVGLSDQFVPGD